MIKSTTLDAYRLIHEGTLALADVEANGIRIDVGRLDRTIYEVSLRIADLTEELKQDEIWKTWQKKFGRKASLGSRTQLGEIVYGELGYKCQAYTSGGKTGKRRPKVDEKELAGIDLPFIRQWIGVKKLEDLRSTYLKGIRREVVDGYLRPSFNLHLVRTYRSSCDHPNFQNIPIREKEIAKLIRPCFIPREGRVFVEVDYSALEFRVAACFWRDDAMVEYASDPDKDIHRDMAAECYCINPAVDGGVPSDVRFFAKNQFVFPTLYGSYYCNTARNLWNVIESGQLTTADGDSLYDHLAIYGIRELGSCDGKCEPEDGEFEFHIKGVEQRFHDRFPQWAKRKEQWQRRYNERGWFRTLTGFICSGIMSRNDLFNYPVQGPAFHLLLWSLIELNKWLKENGMKSMIVGQIHDSIVLDCTEDELDDVLAEAKRIMTKDVRKHWPWVVTPLSIEAEVSRTNWYEKKEVAV